MTKKSIKFAFNPLLSGPSIKDRSYAGSPYRLVPISEIDLDPDQPRRVFVEDALNELAESIKMYGVLSPILVRQTEVGTFRIIAGERRFRASKLAGLEAIPAILDQRDSEDSEKLALQLVENLQRQDLTPMERALAIGQLRDSYSISVREIARRLGISKSMVQRSLEVLQLPDDLQVALISGASESKVLMLAQIADRAQRANLLKQIEGLTREKLEEVVQKSTASRRGTIKKKELGHEDRRIVDSIQRKLGAKVKLSRKPGRGKGGSLTVEFYSADDLDELYRRLT